MVISFLTASFLVCLFLLTLFRALPHLHAPPESPKRTASTWRKAKKTVPEELQLSAGLKKIPKERTKKSIKNRTKNKVNRKWVHRKNTKKKFGVNAVYKNHNYLHFMEYVNSICSDTSLNI